MWASKKPDRHPQLRDFIRLPFLFFSITGIKLFEWDENDCITMRHKVMSVVSVGNLMFNYFSKLAYPIFDVFEDEKHITQMILYITFATLAVCKMLSVWLGRKSLHEVIKDINKNFPRTRLERRIYRLEEHYAIIMKYMNVMATSHWCVALMFIIFPLVQSIVEYMYDWTEDGKFVYRFPYIMTYTFDCYKPWGFAFAYTTQFFGGITVAFFFCGADLLLIGTVYMLLMKFEYLHRRIQQLRPKNNEEDLKELKQLLQFHADIYNFSDRINNVFCISILLNYIISIVVVVLIGFQVIVGTDFFGLIKFVGFLYTSLLQVYYMCLFSTKLQSSSELIAEAWSGHPWYDANIKYKRLMIIAIQRAQRPARLTAYKFFVISMESFTTEIKKPFKKNLNPLHVLKKLYDQLKSLT